VSPAAGILQRIAAGRQARVAVLKAALPLAELRRQAALVPVQGGFSRALAGASGAGLRVIAELKPASPSAGRLRTEFDTRSLAAALAAAGAAALSVLTEPDHFQAEADALARARQGAPRTPLLRKDFLLEEWQIWEARLLGADAILLIAALLPGATLPRLLACAGEAGLETLVEVSGRDELRRATDAGAGIIGVHARDLRDFSVHLDRAVELAASLPREVVAVAESGVRGPEDLTRLATAGYHAALVGTTLMRAPSPGALLAAWLYAWAGRGASS
jgi:indole-3-glycerol phosphate synthase